MSFTRSNVPYRLVVTDIDGTFLDDDGNLPESNRLALDHCRDLGVRTCLATGRRWTTCNRLLDRLALRESVDFCILNNGMILHEVATGKTLYRREFPHALVLQAVERLNTLSIDPIVLGHNADGLTPDVFHRRDCLRNGDFVAKNPGHCLGLDAFEELRDRHLVELILIGSRPELEQAAAALAGLPVETAILRNSYYADHMLEVTPLGLSKLHGVRELLAHLGLTMDQTMAVGDSENDYQMLAAVPRSIAVSNADARIKAIAREITGSNSEGGFGQAVFRHLGNPLGSKAPA